MKLATGLATCIFLFLFLFLVGDSEPGMMESDETPGEKKEKKNIISMRVNLALV